MEEIESAHNYADGMDVYHDINFPGAKRIKLATAELTKADAYVQSHRKEATQLIAEFSGLSLETVQRFLERRPRSPTAPLPAELVAEQQRVAEAFFELGLIPKPVKVAEIVWQPGTARLAQTAR
mgnify:CR=1 FL=1